MKFKSAELFFLFTAVLLILLSCQEEQRKEKKILVFSKTQGYRHASIGDGKAMFLELGNLNNFAVDTTENAGYFVDDSLRNYSAIVFLSSTGEILDYAQQSALKRYVQSGGGVMGVHGASGAEYSWPWYGKLMGARFESHPKELQTGEIIIEDLTDPTNRGLPNPWKFKEEWYNFDSISPEIEVLARVNESSFTGGEHGDNHPIFWKQKFDGGRSFYTALGHRPEAYRDSIFRLHILEGLKYVIDANAPLDYARTNTLAVPVEGHFVRNVLLDSTHVSEPMELAIAKDGRVFYIERKGSVKMLDQNSGDSKTIGNIPVYSDYEDGLLGLTLDPKFEDNHWIYVMYSAPDNLYEYHISRFTLENDYMIDMGSEIILLKVHEEHSESNHTGGSLAFDSKGNLFIAIGDNTNPFGDAHGYAPIDERPDRIDFDAQRSSGNTNDLRGKILRIHPEPNGSYTIPTGNLFPTKGIKGKPEIYVMGTRNSFRISVDPKTSWLYWGDVGPDAGKDSVQGTRGYDEINQAQAAGNFGWPYFVGNNKAFNKVDFASGNIGETFKAEAPVNSSPRNTGSMILPPAKPAFIYYPYAKSDEFSLVGQGGRTAMAGPIYHYDPNLKSNVKLPKYYDKGLFIYDWMRNWILVVRTDESGNYVGMEPFMPSTNFNKIIDMELGPDGALYILEYGKNWYSPNKDARLSKIEFYKDIQIKESKALSVNTDVAKSGHQSNTDLTEEGFLLMEKSDCLACHAKNQKSVGPTFLEIAMKYKNEPKIVDSLVNKVIHGGSGVWGQSPMSAHPQLTKENVKMMISYILNLEVVGEVSE
ncbi:ThuA domain-containing protein [Arenibacter algicola]|uniref:Soluble aldose sugar dehydrogenase YliI n=1 Tax=Arenibacter algicola TaxID=616991 RepID=A0A221V1B9_9FLAO|nr:ThuA domain-containing protein [Arenibacter algicola]ASO07409.1 soluble aldose sugar dehydrogenase YliI [Arenibacter algicola]